MSHKYGDDIRIITPITSSNMSHLTDDQIRELKIETLDTMTGAEIKALLLTMSKKSGNYQQVVSILEKLHSDDEVKSVAIDCIRGCTITPELRQEMIIYTKRRYFKAKSLKKNQTEVNQPIHQPNTTSSSTSTRSQPSFIGRCSVFGGRLTVCCGLTGFLFRWLDCWHWGLGWAGVPGGAADCCLTRYLDLRSWPLWVL